jgi:hypothetical protein
MKTPRLNNLFDLFGGFPTFVFQTRLTRGFRTWKG